jgi:hypothetical protein
MLGPTGKRGGFFRFVTGAIVNPRNAPLVSRNMIQDRFDHMRGDTDLGHAGSGGAAKIMQGPAMECFGFGIMFSQIFENLLVEPFLAARETGKTALPLPENKVPVFDVVLGQLRDDIHSLGNWGSWVQIPPPRPETSIK